MFAQLANNFLVTVTEVSKNWNEARRMRFNKKHKKVLEKLRAAQNAQGDGYNDDVLGLAEQDFVDFQVAFNLEVMSHNKEVGVV